MNFMEDMLQQTDSETYPLVFRWGQAMEAKLGRNRHKGDRDGWLSCTPEWLLERLKEEVAELEEALSLAKDPICVADECIDISNFALMVADTYIHAFKDAQKKGSDASRPVCDGSPDRADEPAQGKGSLPTEGIRESSPQDGCGNVGRETSNTTQT